MLVEIVSVKLEGQSDSADIRVRLSLEIKGVARITPEIPNYSALVVLMSLV